MLLQLVIFWLFLSVGLHCLWFFFGSLGKFLVVSFLLVVVVSML